MTELTIPWFAAIIGLLIAIGLILVKLNPTYSLILGAVSGALIGGANLSQTLAMVIGGAESVMGTVIRILSAGVFAGVMMESGAAETIARFIVNKLGGAMSLFALGLATMVITAVGVFIPVAVLIVAPIALSVAEEEGYSKLATLVALSGGGKAGNVISPNPNTIAVANGFGISSVEAMTGAIIPAIVGLLVTVLMANSLKNKGEKVTKSDLDEDRPHHHKLPTVGRAFATPIMAIILLMWGPITQVFGLEGLTIDSFFVLPVAGILGLIVMGKTKQTFNYCVSGLERMTPTILIIIGAGTIGGLISASDLSAQIINLMTNWHIPSFLLAPIAGILMGGATGSTSTGVILASGSFGSAILQTGVAPAAAAIMVHTGATVIDQMPHGSYFHVTRDAVKMTFSERMTVFLYEAIIGCSMVVTATILYGFILN